MLLWKRLKLTTKTTALTIFLIALSVGSVGTVSLYVVMSGIENQVVERQGASLRIAATVAKEFIPDLGVRYSKANTVERIVIDELPTQSSHDMIDKIGLLTGETATIFAWDESARDFVRATTNIIKPNGQRAVGTMLGKKGAVYPVIMRGETYMGEAVILGLPYYTIYQPIFTTKGKIVGILYAGVRKDKMNAVLSKIENVLGIGTALALLISVLIALFGFRAMLRPLPRLSAAMDRLATGDVSTEVPFLAATDETGDMARAVQVFKDNLNKSREMETERERNQQARDKRTRAMEALISDFDVVVTNLLGNVSNAAGHVETAARTVLDNAQGSSERTGAVASTAEEASTNVQTVATASTQLSSSIHEISRQVGQSTQVASTAVTEVAGANEKVQSLADAAAKIGEVVSLITDVAEQTNLLALNATIEAARAGDAGKGFAVVASEVKNLANQTARATEEISLQINGVQAATQDAVGAIGNIGEIIASMNKITAEISIAVEKQGVATQEITRNVDEAANGTQQVSSIIGDVADATNNTRDSANDIIEATDTMGQEFNTLRGQVSTFLGQVRDA
jgi:methyl-accepting chemotaxis protein